MDRRIKFIDRNKWYHIESLKKHFKKEGAKGIQYDINEKPYEVILFRSGFCTTTFVVHPKTKRLKYLTIEALKELGYT